ncbi:MAG: hypothetical protein M3011_03705 [Actinomycetota bacterium]|nr:hypothetical protein [Actinomycetota bacterium]
MPETPRNRRSAVPTRLRWLAAPLAAAVAVGTYAMAPTLAGADSPPTLAPISARDLLAKVEQAKVSGLSGEITVKSNLGLPDVSQFVGENGNLATSLITGTHTVKVWEAGGNARLALPSTLAETDVVHNDNGVWVWDSTGQQVRHLAAQPHDTAGDGNGNGEHADSPDGASAAGAEPTPQALADHFLSSVDATTRVLVRDTATVAGRPAYELVLAPKSGTTLVADVVVAVDSATGLPLRVQVLSRDSGTPAIDVGFSSVDFAVPPASTFAFTPPPGSTVTEVHSAAALLLPSGGADGHTGPDRAPKAAPDAPPASDSSAGPASNADAGPTVVGKGWDAVAIIDLGADGTAKGLATLGKLGSHVQGAWGAGSLIHTTLVNVLITDDHKVVIGSVPEAALEAALAGH